MAIFKRFEDIIAWQKARTVTRQIYLASTRGEFARDFELRSQLRRASVSIMANIAEGFGRKSDREFANFLNIAHGSAYEVQSDLYVALDLNYLDLETFNDLYQQLDEICRILFSLRRSLMA